MEQKYWLKGGVTFMVLMSIFAFGSYSTQAISIFTLVAPVAYLGLLSLGMRGEPAGMLETVLTLSITIGITLFSYFIIGVILGFIYKRIRGKIVLLRILAIIIFIVLGSLIYFGTNPTYTSISKCESPITQLRAGFQKDVCYWSVARIKKDISVCDHLPDNRGNFSKYGCYATVASDNRDPSICTKIPEVDEWGEPSRHLSDCIFYAQR